MNDGALVIAWHGCDISVRDGLLRGDLDFKPSTNRYDWLGSGGYFFEGDARRAMRFAEASQAHPERFYTRQPVVQAAVVGAVLCISRWLDMTTQEGIEHYRQAHGALKHRQAMAGKPMLVNTVADDRDQTILLRQLDCAVFNTLHALRDDLRVPPFQAIRAAFYQGKAIAPTSEFQEDTHVQIAVRDLSCIVGWFLPKSARMLDLSDYFSARLAVSHARRAATKKKPRRSVRVA